MWFTPQTERVIVLSKILALNKSLALLLSVLLAASVGAITIEQYPRISCHDNFLKAKRVSMGLTVKRKTAKNLAVRRKNERILAVSRKKN